MAEKNITFENVELPEELREIPASANEDKTVECPSEPSVKLVAPTRKYTVEELLEAAGKYHLKSFLGFIALYDGLYNGFDWILNEIENGHDLGCDIDKREKKINAILRRNDVLDDSGEISEAVVFHKFTELFEVSEKNAKYLETNINKLEDTIKAAILWQIKYMVALKLEPCDDHFDYGPDENAEWTLDTLYEAISNESEEVAKKTRHLVLPSKLGIYNVHYDGILKGTIVDTAYGTAFYHEKKAWDMFYKERLEKLHAQIDSVLNEANMPSRGYTLSGIGSIIDKIKSEIGMPVGYEDDPIEELIGNLDDDSMIDIGWELKRILAEHFDTEEPKKLDCYSSYELSLLEVVKLLVGEPVPDKNA